MAHDANALFPMLVTLAGSMALGSLAHDANAFSPMWVTPVGMVIPARLVQL
jgi:hypothetical protein